MIKEAKNAHKIERSEKEEDCELKKKSNKGRSLRSWTYAALALAIGAVGVEAGWLKSRSNNSSSPPYSSKPAPAESFVPMATKLGLDLNGLHSSTAPLSLISASIPGLVIVSTVAEAVSTQI
jgi:hypothetical protein